MKESGWGLCFREGDVKEESFLHSGKSPQWQSRKIDRGFSTCLWLLLSILSPLERLADSSFSFSGFWLPLLRLTLISKLNLKSPLFGLVRLTALQDWFPLCPLLVVFPVCLTELSQSIIESPLDTSSEESPPVFKKGRGEREKKELLKLGNYIRVLRNFILEKKNKDSEQISHLQVFVNHTTLICSKSRKVSIPF